MTVRSTRPETRGFSLIELLITVAIMSALAGGAILRMEWIAEDARGAALRHNLKAIRQGLDDFHADRRRWPASLDQLVLHRYLREVPVDPTTGANDTWITVPSTPGATDVHDVRSRTEAFRCH